jgi:hypothetical protein
MEPPKLFRAILSLPSRLFARLSRNWEAVFFLFVYGLLLLQDLFLFTDVKPLAAGFTAVYAAVEHFLAFRLMDFVAPVFLLPLLWILLAGRRLRWHRSYFDVLGTYVVIRMVAKLIGLNILLFDAVTAHFILIKQLLFFLPYSLLVWGWIYWRLDVASGSWSQPMFRLDHEGDLPRPVDYLVASFSSALSPSFSGIKGNYARARVLVLLHGFMIYDVMGLTLTRAVALVENR